MTGRHLYATTGRHRGGKTCCALAAMSDPYPDMTASHLRGGMTDRHLSRTTGTGRHRASMPGHHLCKTTGGARPQRSRRRAADVGQLFCRPDVARQGGPLQGRGDLTHQCDLLRSYAHPQGGGMRGHREGMNGGVTISNDDRHRKMERTGGNQSGGPLQWN